MTGPMIELLVMLGEEVGAVVPTVRSSHDGVDVMAAGNFVVEHDTGVMVELDEDHRAVHAVVERRVVVEASVPREPRLVDVRGNLFHPHLGVPGTGPIDVGA